MDSFPVSDGVTDAVPIVIGNAQSTLGDSTALDFHDGVFYPVWADNSESLPAEADWLRVNMGGGDVTAPGGLVWEADTAYLGQPAGEAAALVVAQDASKVRRPAPAAVYQAVRHSADVPNAEDHAFTLEAIPAGRYDVRIHFSSPQELSPAGEDHAFDVFIQGSRVLEEYIPAEDPALAANPGRDQVVARGFWNRIVVTGGDLEIRSVPVPPPSGQAGDSFELAIEVAESTHSDIHTRKVVVGD